MISSEEELKEKKGKLDEMLLKEKHVKYFLYHLAYLPTPYESQDINRMVLLYFCVHGLALLKSLHRIANKEMIVQWVYAMQIHPDCNDPSMNWQDCGFRGGTSLGIRFDCPKEEYECSTYDTSSIATTYTALCILKTLGDDLGRVNKTAIVKALGNLCNSESGSFSSVRFGSEEDMRFVFCACAISEMLDDWSSVNKQTVLRYIQSCQAYDGGMGIGPFLEAQGGATYCAVASLALCEKLDEYPGKQRLVHWLMMRQGAGFQGRCNKSPDSCYAYWNGASLHLMDKHDMVDIPSSKKFVLSCQNNKMGGFAKFPDTYPDLLHSYYSLAWLGIAGDPNLGEVDCRLGIPKI